MVFFITHIYVFRKLFIIKNKMFNSVNAVQELLSYCEILIFWLKDKSSKLYIHMKKTSKNLKKHFKHKMFLYIRI